MKDAALETLSKKNSGDPRIAKLIERYAYAAGDAMLGQRKVGKMPTTEEVAGWFLSQTQGDPIAAVRLVANVRMPMWQRNELLSVLRPLTTSVDLRALIAGQTIAGTPKRR